MFIDSPLPIVPSLYNRPGVVPMTSGVMVLYADDEFFSVMTPEGFPVAGWNNFSVFDEDDTLVAQVQSYERASDPIYEFGFPLHGRRGAPGIYMGARLDRAGSAFWT